MTATGNAHGGDAYAIERERRAGCAVWLASQCVGWSASCICRPVTPAPWSVPPVRRGKSDRAR